MSVIQRASAAASRRRLLVAVLAAALLVAIVVVVACGGSSGEDSASGPPASRALALIPADALVALDLSTDGGRPAVRRAGVLAGRLPSWPGLRASLLGRLDERGCGVDLRRDDGDEVAFALLPGAGGSASPLLLTDAPARDLGSGRQQCGVLAAQRIGGLVAIGDSAALSAAAAVDAGTRGALVERPVFRRAAAGLPRERVITAWASTAGTRRLLEPLGGLLGTLGAIVDTPGLRGAVGALVAEDSRARITIKRVATGDGEPAFAPRLQASAPADAISYVGSGDLAGGLQRLLLLRGAAATTTLDQLLAGRDHALQRLSRLVRESAFVVSPGARQPRVTLMARVSDGRGAAARMRALEGRLAPLAGAAAGTRFADADLGGPARILSSGGATLAYGFDGDVLVISSDAAGVRAARDQKRSLADTAAFRGVVSGLPPRVSALVFVDPNQLLRLGADTGTGLEDALQDVRDDLARVRAIGLHTSGAGKSSTVDLSLKIP